MQRRSALSLLFILLFFISCQKEVNPVDDVNPPVTAATGDSTYLDKIYNLYNTGSGTDTQSISVFDYDNLKRLTSINDSLSVNNNTEWTYDYTGTDTLLYKSTYVNADLNFPATSSRVSGSDVETEIYTYKKL